LYYSLSIIRMIKSRRVRWAGTVAPLGRGGEERIWDIGRKAGRKETTRKTKM
jgi:hypothetical protein